MMNVDQPQCVHPSPSTGSHLAPLDEPMSAYLQLNQEVLEAEMPGSEFGDSVESLDDADVPSAKSREFWRYHQQLGEQALLAQVSQALSGSVNEMAQNPTLMGQSGVASTQLTEVTISQPHEDPVPLEQAANTVTQPFEVVVTSLQSNNPFLTEQPSELSPQPMEGVETRSPEDLVSTGQAPSASTQPALEDRVSLVTVDIGGTSDRPCFRFSTKTSNTILLYLIPLVLTVVLYILTATCEYEDETWFTMGTPVY